MMDRETIIKLANETLDKMAPDDYCRAPYWTATDDELEHFAKLLAEHVIKNAPDYKMGYADGVAAECTRCISDCLQVESSKQLSPGVIACVEAIKARKTHDQMDS